MLPVVFDPLWRLAPGAADLLLAQLQRVEQRQRRRRAADAARYADSVDCLAANLSAAHLAAPGHAVTVPTHTTASARSPVFGRGFNAALETAERAGLLVRGRAGPFSTVRLSPAGLEILPPPTWAGLRVAAAPSPLLLRGAKDARGRAPALPVPDTPETRRMAAEVRTLSEWLGGIPVTLAGASGWAQPTPDGSRLRVVSTRHTACVRIFNGGRMDWGGRLYRGWWLAMSKADRLARVRIGGEPLAEIDYSGMFLRLAYRHARAAWPFGETEDPYLVAPFADRAHRAGMKACTLALLNGAKGRQFPDGAADQFPAGTRPAQVYAAIRGRHPALQTAGAFGAALGHTLTRTESDLMVRLLLRLRREKLAALPIHDALVTPVSHAQGVAEVMQGEALRALGCNLPVRIYTQGQVSASGLHLHE